MSKSTQTYVELHITLKSETDQSEEVTITRRNNSAKLTYESSEYDYLLEDEEAQNMIDNEFGDITMWGIGSYIGQKEKERNLFVQAKQKHRKEILYSLAPSLDNDANLASTSLEDVDNDILSIKNDHKKQQSLYDELETTYKKMKKEINLKIYPDAQVSEYSKIGKKISSTLKNREKELSDAIQHNTRISSLNIQIDKNQKLLSEFKKKFFSLTNPMAKVSNIININTNPDDDMSGLPGVMKSLSSILNLIANINRLKSKLTISHLKKEKRYTELDYNNILTQEKSHDTNRKLALQHHIDYDEEIVKLQINKYEKHIHLFDEYLNIKNKGIDKIQKPVFIILQPVLPIKPNQSEFPPLNTHSLLSQIEALSELIAKREEEVVKPNISELEAKIKDNQRYLSLLHCPHCDNPVRYYNGTLIKETNNGKTKIDLEEEIIECEKKIDDLETQYERGKEEIKRLKIDYKKKKEELKKREDEHKINKRLWDKFRNETELYNVQLETYNLKRDVYERELSEYNKITGEISRLKSLTTDLKNHYGTLDKNHILDCISDLKQIHFIDKPKIKSSDIRKRISEHKIYDEIVVLKSELRSKLVSRVIPDQKSIEKLIYDIEIYNLEFNKLSNNIQLTSDQISTLNSQLLKEGPAISDTIITELESDIIKYKEEKDALSKCILVQSLYERVINLDEELVKLEDELGALTLFRDYLVKAQCRILDNLVLQINMRLNEVTMLLFEETFVIELSLERELKTKKCMKTEVGFRITNKGQDFDIKDLSGGEEDRVSFAFILVLSQFSKCPLLVFDESLKFLDDKHRESSILALRKFAPDKTVIMINHEGVIGYYDEVIDI
jgi:DNA repair exonuclease SbcCD ATPase subunit